MRFIVLLAVACQAGDDSRSCRSSPEDLCDGVSICIDGWCEPAYHRTYSVEYVQLFVKHPNWDDPPDVYLGSEAFGFPITPVVHDSYSTVFNGPFEWHVLAGQTIELTAWDDDWPQGPTRLLSCRYDATAALLRTRRLHCESETAWLAAVVTPHPESDYE